MSYCSPRKHRFLIEVQVTELAPNVSSIGFLLPTQAFAPSTREEVKIQQTQINLWELSSFSEATMAAAH